MTYDDNFETNPRFLEAMLYALNDPALDREAFERDMADDPELAFLVSSAVQLAVEMKDSFEPSLASRQGYSEPIRSELPSANPQPAGWVLAGILCASTVFGWIAWNRIFYSEENHHSDRDLVTAWSMFRAESGAAGVLETELSPVSYLEDTEPSLVENDEEFPSWLIAATATESSDGAIQ
jgi:hypothetical protein